MDHEQYERIIDRLIDYKNEKLLLPDEAYLKLDYSKEFVEYAYHERLAHSESRASKLAKIDNANYLENYLLPFYSHLRAKESHALTNSILLLINHKFQENVNFWEYFNTTDLRDKFKALFEHLASMHLSELNYSEKIEFLMFLINTFRCYEEDFISEICLKYVGYPLWKNLSATFLKSLFLKYPNLLRAYKKHVLNKTFEHRQTEFMIECINHFWVCMGEIKKGTMEVENGDGQHQQIYSDEQVKYFEKFIELCIDLLSQVPTRSHFRFLLLDQNFVVKCKLTQLYHSEQGSLFKKLIEMLQASQDYPLHEENGTVMTDSMITLLHYDKMAEFQNVLFKNFKERFASSLVKNVSNIDSRKSLIEILDYLSDEEVVLICQKLNIPLPPPEFFENASFFRADLSYLDLVIEILLDHLIKKKRTIDIANHTPHYPTEKLLWDKNLIPEDMYFGRKTLPLPKLNLQFLSIEDYLIRNYNLFRLEASYEIKANIEDSITRVHANFDKTGNFSSFNGWARMATEVKEFSVHEVQPPKIGDIYPSNVFAELRYSVQNMKMAFKKEWEQLKKHDVIFLVSFKKNLALWENKNEEDMNFLEKYSIQYIRGAEVISQLDEDRNEIGNQDFNERSSNPEGNSRFLQVQLDPVQYKIDLETLGEKDNEVYGSFHLVIRRKAKENNFKAILSTIKELINSNLTIPDWLEDVLLGYGSLKSEEYIEFRNKNFNPKSVNYFDTFLDKRHYEETFANNSNIPAHDKEVPTPSALIQKNVKSSEKPWLYDWKIDFNLPYYAEEFRKIDIQRRKNAIRFTSKQVEAIYSGVNEGLTLIEGPPGTGKTDVAVQIISLIYHNYPNERTLLITHSNHALNDLFEKITKLDINERYLLRLGMGEKELETSQDFSRYGRVNYMLERRIILLNEVQKLSQSLVVNIYPEFTCETAEILYKYHIESRWQEYEELVLHAHKKTEKASASNKEIALKFPFLRYLKMCRFLTRSGNMDDEDGRSVEEIPEEDLAKQFFDFKDVEGDIERANFYWQIIHNMFKELEECRAFEILRSNRERSNYLVSKQAKIIAMTCTHAALKRVDLIESGFEYDNVLIEEAGQILEIESFIPLVLQKPRFGKTSRLKRFILIGDHNQLPPIIKNNAFQKFSQMEQSMFTRLVRLKIPYDCLSHQGRMRPSLLKLFGWRYPYLDNLPTVVSNPESSNPTEYDFENAGFAHEYQFIDVPDFNGKGESSPMPYFYQNLAEAEYVVATYMYMVLNGYPPEKISILTTYNGQKFLIRDIIHQKCSWNPIFGKPAKITTVDKYQGQQNDYILLSLVRTEHVGHLRDPRRLTVAMSRARLGLFIFGRFELFSGCHELRNTFKTLMSKPLKLYIVPQETYPSQRRAGDPKQNVSGQPIEDFQHLYKVVQSKLQEMSAGAK